MVWHIMEDTSDVGLRSCKPFGPCKVFKFIESDIPNFLDEVVREDYPICFSVQRVSNQTGNLC